MTTASGTYVAPWLGEWNDVCCGLDGCGAPLHMERTTSLAILGWSTVSDLRSDGHTSSWSVTCQNGHVVLLPYDTGGNSTTFDECQIHDPGESHNSDCDDMARLRRVIKQTPASAQPCGGPCG